MTALLNTIYPKIASIPWRGTSLPGIVDALALKEPYALWESSRIPCSSMKEAKDTHRFGFIALGCQRSSIYQHNIIIEHHRGLEVQRRPGKDPLEPAAEFLEHSKHYASPEQCAEHFGLELPAFIGGLIAALSYDAGSEFENIRGTAQHPEQAPSIYHFVDSLLILDKKKQRLLHVLWPNEDAESFALESLVEHEHHSLHLEQAAPISKQGGFSAALLENVEILRSKQKFVEMVRVAQEYIAAGDIFQVVLANRLRLNQALDPLALYQELRRENPSPYHFLFPWQNGHLVGASPESMLRCLSRDSSGERIVSMRLVAGTYPRDCQEEDLEQIAAKFWEDEKERAEHVMLVDHVRNDIGRSAKIGSVNVTELLSVEPYRDVYHLVSEVQGSLSDNLNSLDALRSAFPIATLTGTPKIRAMEIIAEVEEAHRGFFGGTLLVLGFDGFLDAGVTIRSAVLEADATHISVGAGIVFDSIAEREYEECLWKARSVLQAVHSLQQRLAA